MLEGFNSYNEKAKILTDATYASGDRFTLTKDIETYSKGETFILSDEKESHEHESIMLDEGDCKLYLLDEVGRNICLVGSEKSLHSLFKHKNVVEHEVVEEVEIEDPQEEPVIEYTQGPRGYGGIDGKDGSSNDNGCVWCDDFERLLSFGSIEFGNNCTTA